MAMPLAVKSPSTLRTTSASPIPRIRGDHFLGVGRGGVAGHSELFGCPHSEQPIAAGLGLELLLRVHANFFSKPSSRLSNVVILLGSDPWQNGWNSLVAAAHWCAYITVAKWLRQPALSRRRQG
jgi:hypothetical protein